MPQRMQMEGKRREGNGRGDCREKKNFFAADKISPLPLDEGGGGSSYCFSVRKVMDSLKKGSVNCIQKPPSSACEQLEKGGKCLSYQRQASLGMPTGLLQHFSYPEKHTSSAQSPQSLDSCELQLREVLDGVRISSSI